MKRQSLDNRLRWSRNAQHPTNENRKADNNQEIATEYQQHFIEISQRAYSLDKSILIVENIYNYKIMKKLGMFYVCISTPESISFSVARASSSAIPSKQGTCK
jgi:hypothetical protein